MEKDIYRDTPVRYLGYANEIGEAFRAFIGSKWVLASYGVATSYVLADTLDKTIKTHRTHHQVSKTLYTATDVLVWQMLASVMIPGFTINRVCALSNYLIKKSGSMPKQTRQAVVAGIGLATIPFIIKPIDHFCDALLDNTIRKLAP